MPMKRRGMIIWMTHRHKHPIVHMQEEEEEEELGTTGQQKLSIS
jgi:hypothetical protein